MNQTAQSALILFGGTGRMKAMLGAYNFSYSDKDMSFQFMFKGSKKASLFKISYDDGQDLFNLEFGKIGRKKDKELGIYSMFYNKTEEIEGVYVDQVVDIFEKVTGLYTSL